MACWMFVVTALSVLWGTLSFCRAASDADDHMEEFKIVSPASVTPEPTAPPVEPWMRYPVPLDDELQKYIEIKCAEYGVDAPIVFAMIGVESGYNPAAVGDNGHSIGLMQIWQDIHTDRMQRLCAADLRDPYQNVLVGIDLLAELMDYGNGLDWALSFYNGHGGEPCEYAVTVQRNAECLLEGAMLVTE